MGARIENRDSLQNRVSKVLGHNEKFVPILRVSHLKAFMEASLRHPDLITGVLKKLVRGGVLDYSQTGNYSIESRVAPGFFMNPESSEERLCFVSGYQCDQYRKEIEEGTGNSLKVVKHDPFVMPPEIDSRMWRVLRLKSQDYRDRSSEKTGIAPDNVVEMLVARGTLSAVREGNFRIVRKDQSLNFFGRENARNTEYFFTDNCYAHSCASSLPCHEETSVISLSRDDR